MNAFVLVFWEQEDSVSVVPSARVKGDLIVGEECEVIIQQKAYCGRVTATGKPM